MKEALFPGKCKTIYGTAGRQKHLIIICSDPFPDPYQDCLGVISVNVTTWRDKPDLDDDACILNVGDHPFIHHKSFVFYEQAVVLQVPLFMKRIQNKDFEFLDPVSEDVLNRVLQGFFKSEKTPKKLLSLIKYLNLCNPN